MRLLRRCLLAAAERRLCESQINLPPEVESTHSALTECLRELRQEASLFLVWRLWWYARCVERGAYHAARAEACRR